MSAGAFVPTLACGAVLLAFWVDMRLGRRTPSTPGVIFLHSVVAYASLQFMGVIASATMSPDAPARTLLVLFAVVLPPFVYSFLAAIWLLKLLRGLQLR